jgi:hypothetical protein
MYALCGAHGSNSMVVNHFYLCCRACLCRRCCRCCCCCRWRRHRTPAPHRSSQRTGESAALLSAFGSRWRAAAAAAALSPLLVCVSEAGCGNATSAHSLVCSSRRSDTTSRCTLFHCPHYALVYAPARTRAQSLTRVRALDHLPFRTRPHMCMLYCRIHIPTFALFTCALVPTAARTTPGASATRPWFRARATAAASAPTASSPT